MNLATSQNYLSDKFSSPSSKLLFTCGFPGGGTDLIKTIVNAHPDVFINGEMPFLVSLTRFGYNQSTTFSNIEEIKSLQTLLKRLDTWGNMRNINHDFSDDLKIHNQLSLEDVLKRCFSNSNMQVWGNKTPQNTENIDQLDSLFSKPYFLIITRDVRDICVSWQNKWSKDVYLCAEKWKDRMARGWQSTSGIDDVRFIYIKFEDLLVNTELMARQICLFLNIPFSEKMLMHHKYTEQGIDGKVNYGAPIIPGNKGKWKNQFSEKKISRIEEISFETMNIFGYVPEFAEKQRPISSFEKLQGLIRDTLAMVFVGNTASNQNSFSNRLKFILFEFKKMFFSKL